MILLSLFIRFVLEVCYFDWKNIEADDNAYSLHISLSGFWIVLCFFRKIYIPSFQYYMSIVKIENQKRIVELARQERLSAERRLARNENDLLELILADAKNEKLSLDMQTQDLKKKISIKQRDVEALRQKVAEIQNRQTSKN